MSKKRKETNGKINKKNNKLFEILGSEEELDEDLDLSLDIENKLKKYSDEDDDAGINWR